MTDDTMDRALMELLPTPGLLLDAQYRVRGANRQAAALLSSPPELLLGTPVWQQAATPVERLRWRLGLRLASGRAGPALPWLGLLRSRGGVLGTMCLQPLSTHKQGWFVTARPSSFTDLLRLVTAEPCLQDAVLPVRCNSVPAHQPWLGLASLSSRERDVLGLLLSGSSPAQMSARLGIRLHTVRNHTRGVYGKLRVRCRDELLSSVLGILEQSRASFGVDTG